MHNTIYEQSGGSYTQEMKKALSASGADGTRAGCAKTDVSPTQIF